MKGLIFVVLCTLAATLLRLHRNKPKPPRIYRVIARTTVLRKRNRLRLVI